MTRKMKLTGIVLAAVFAFGAYVAAAQAGVIEVEAGAGGAEIVKGEQKMKHVFTATPGKTECATANFTGAVINSSETLTLAPEYKTCSTAGIGGTTVTVNNCKFLIHIGNTEMENPDRVLATADIIECPTTAPIVITTVVGCKLTISNQNGLTGITLETNTGVKPHDVIAFLNGPKIMYDEDGPAAKCGAGTTEGTHEDGTLTGTATLGGIGGKGITVT